MRNFVETEFPKLLDLIYRAGLDPVLWQDVLNAFHVAFGGAQGLLLQVNAETRKETSLVKFSGGTPDAEDAYLNYYASINPYPLKAFTSYRTGVVASAAEVVDPGIVKTTEYYNDFMKPQGITPEHFGVVLRNNERDLSLMAILPHASVCAKNQRKYISQLRLLTPHLMRALEINRTLSEAISSRRTLAFAVDAFDAPVFVVGTGGRVKYINSFAERLLHQHVLGMSRDGALHAAQPAQNQALSSSIDAALSLGSKASTGPIRLTSVETGSAYLAWVVGFSASESTDMLRSRICSVYEPRDACAIVIVRPVTRGLAIPVEAIRVMFGLTLAEARLASALVNGETVDEYSLRTRRTRNTVRNQLSSIFAKVDVQRQSQMVSHIVSMLSRR